MYKRIVFLTIVLTTSAYADWVPYAHRYALIVMGGQQTGQLYNYYWMDTSAMYNRLKEWGFQDTDIYFLAYGPSVQGQAIVDAISNQANVLSTLDTIANRSSQLSNFFKINFDTQGTEELWTCIRLLEKDLDANKITFTRRAPWEAASSIPLVDPH